MQLAKISAITSRLKKRGRKKPRCSRAEHLKIWTMSNFFRIATIQP